MGIFGKIGGAAAGAGIEVAKTAGKGFLEGALGRTVGGGISSGLSKAATGSQKSGKQTGTTGDDAKDMINAIRDLQSDSNSNGAELKSINDNISGVRETLGNGFVALYKSGMDTNKLLSQILSKMGPGGFINNVPDINIPRNAPGAPSKPGAPGRAGAALRGVGGRLPVVGGVIAGGMEYAETGNIGRSIASGAGTAIGGALGAIGGSIAGPVGTVAGGVGGGYAGEKAGTALYDRFFGSNNKTEKMAELDTKEAEQKAKAASTEKDSITYNAKEIIFKSDKLTFEYTKKEEKAAGGPGGGFADNAPAGITPSAPSAAPGGSPSSVPSGGPGGSSVTSAPPASSGGGSSRAGGGGGRGSGSYAANDLPAEAKALLGTISSGESGGRYDIINYVAGGGKPAYFQGTRHPYEGKKGYTASGRYQFLWTTWAAEAKAMGIDPKEFTPENQDRAAWSHAQRIYREKTKRNLSEDMKNPQMHGYITNVLRPTWHGIGGGAQLSRELSKASNANAAAADTGTPSSGGSIKPTGAVPGGAAAPQKTPADAASADRPAAGAKETQGKIARDLVNGKEYTGSKSGMQPPKAPGSTVDYGASDEQYRAVKPLGALARPDVDYGASDEQYRAVKPLGALASPDVDYGASDAQYRAVKPLGSLASPDVDYGASDAQYRAVKPLGSLASPDVDYGASDAQYRAVKPLGSLASPDGSVVDYGASDAEYRAVKPLTAGKIKKPASATPVSKGKNGMLGGPVSGAPAAPSGSSQSEVAKLWEKYNESGSAADFIRADKAMRAAQSASGGATVAGGAGGAGGARVKKGFSAAVEAAAAQARIAGRGRFMNQGQFGPQREQFGPNLPVDYGESDASLRAQEAAASSAASMGFGAGGADLNRITDGAELTAKSEQTQLNANTMRSASDSVRSAPDTASSSDMGHGVSTNEVPETIQHDLIRNLFDDLGYLGVK